MSNLKIAGVVLSLAVLAGCSSNPTMDQEPPEIVNATAEPKTDMSNLPENVPDWYINLPRDTEGRIYASGAGLSSDLQFSMDKAMHQAKIFLGDKINSTVSAEIKTYMTDNSTIGNGVTIEETQRISKSGFKNIDVSEYQIINKSIYRERNKFRSYVLLVLDVTNKDDRKQPDNITTPVDIESIRNAQDNARESMDNL